MQPRTVHTLTAFVAVITQLLTRNTEAAKGDDSDNQPEFAILCHLIRATQTGFKEQPIKLTDTANSAFNSIQQIHILAGNNDTQIEDAIAQAVAEQDKRPKLIPHTASGDKAKGKINETYAFAKKIKEKVEEESQKAKDAIQKANKLLAEALTGDENKQKDDGDQGSYFAESTDDKMFGSGASKNKNCGGNGDGSNDGANTGVTLINDLICLCISGPNGGHKKLCARTQTAADDNSVNYNTPSSTFKRHYASIIKKCPPVPPLVTPQTLAAALMNFNNLIGAQSGRADSPGPNSPYILGLSNTAATGCTGADNQVCVNYKVQLSGEQPKGIPWQTKIQQAIEKAAEATPGVSTRPDETALIQLNATIWNQYKNAFVAQTALVDPGNPSPKLLDPKKAEECKIHKPKKECEENNCKWDGKTETDGECKPKAGSEGTEKEGQLQLGVQRTMIKPLVKK
uniref:Variant surface glycoprotein n=1 Tax=Trypanosoma brucei TaxID=5691 RepID=A0A1V0FY78_9TRYP|nr:variant surface glycoprotein [Trypanosoma brucei]